MSETSVGAERIRLATFFIPLTEPLALPHAMTIGFEEDGESGLAEGTPGWVVENVPTSPGVSLARNFVSLRLWHAKSSMVQIREQFAVAARVARAVTGGREERAQGDDDGCISTLTVIEAITPVLGGDTPVEQAFDRCLARVSQLATAYGLASKQSLAPVTRARLPMFVHVAYRWSDSRSFDESDLFTLNYNDVLRHQPVPVQEARVAHFAGELQLGGPLVSYMQVSAEARRFFDREGDARAAVIMAQTACEVLLDGLLSAMLWEEGVSPADASTNYFQVALASRVKKHYSTRLAGGPWTLEGRGPVADWHTQLAALRNRCVHGGYTPSHDEAIKASQAELALLEFVMSRLRAKRAIFPRASLLFGLPNPAGDRTRDIAEFLGWRRLFAGAGA
jgi:hypothetical protein